MLKRRAFSGRILAFDRRTVSPLRSKDLREKDLREKDFRENV